MKKYLISISLLSFFNSFAFSQKTALILNKVSGNPESFYYRGVSDEDTSDLKVPANLSLKFYRRYFTTMAPIEENFRMYKAGKFDYPTFLKRIKTYTHSNVDTTLLAKNIQKFPSSTIHFISGINGNGNKVILVDANQDNVISGNEIFVYTPDMVNKVKADKRVSLSFPNVVLHQTSKDGIVRDFDLKLIPLPYFDNEKDSIKKATAFYLLRNEYWFGRTTLDGQSFSFYFESQQFVNEIQLMHYRIKCDSVLDKRYFDVKDLWSNAKLSLTVDSLYKLNEKQIKIFISYQSPPKKVNDTTFTMSLQKVSNNRYETLNSFLHNKKYILIDYWGTWCVPCIEKLPKLKELYQKFSDKLQLISIAYDYDINTVKQFDDKNNVGWNDYYINRNNLQNLTKPLNVYEYPTFRLYNDSGKLIFSGETEGDLEKISGLLSK
jgi:thiol-disulfide isomerase/thioredoxin